MPRQLTLDLPVRTALGREDFFVSPANALAVTMIDAPARWPQGKLLLVGPEGAGKSHLAAVWAGNAGAATVEARALTSDAVPQIARHRQVLVENAHAVAGNSSQEAALFHLHNLLLDLHGQLLMTASAAPGLWGLGLPDLRSRMEATSTVTIAPPDDALLSAVFLKLFADRQVQVAPGLITYLIARTDRSFATARKLVAVLDARALALGRPVTRALAAEMLDSADDRAP